MTLSPTKTHISHIKAGFDFLGFNIRKYKGKLLIKPARKNVQRFVQKLKREIQTHLHSSPLDLITLLNPKLKGWAQFYRHGVSKRVFGTVDHQLFWALWRWARKRHPNKSQTWCARQYFQHPRHKFHFCTYLPGATGERRCIELFHTASTPIKRHVKVRNQANPYDPAWADYFALRQEQDISQDIRLRRDWMQLWQEQQGYCLLCQQRLSRETGWHVHHLQPLALGGYDTIDNCVLLHPNCHRQVHSRGIAVSKPHLRGEDVCQA